MWNRRSAQFFLPFILSLLVILWSKLPAAAQNELTDVQGHWAQPCIESLAQQEIISGYLDRSFRPEATVTRAEFSVMVSKAFPALKSVRTGADFLDVPPNHWAYSAVQTAYQTGFLSGYPGGAFHPSEPIVRVQALGSIATGLGYRTDRPTEAVLANFTDSAAIPGYARGPIAAATTNGAIVNYPNVRQLRPNQPITRGELASALCRTLPSVAALVPTQYVAQATGAPMTQPQPQPVSTQSEIRGVWITNVDSAVLFDRAALSKAVQELAEMNFNTLYPTVWNWGYTQYPSEVMKAAIDAPYDPRPVGLGRDFLTELIQQGHEKGLAVLPWFEFGFMVPEDSAMAIRHPDWLTQKRDGSITWQEGIYPRVWLNPFKPEVQNFIESLVLELVTQYDIDGIQFDDHYGLQYEFGYDPYTVALYKQEHNGNAPPANPQDSEWIRWRAGKITQFTDRLFRAVKARKDKVIFALSPNNYAFSLSHSLQDWRAWQQQGLLEEIVLQAYRDDLGSFTNEISNAELREASRRIPTGVGIITGLKRKFVPVSLIRSQVQAVRQQGYPGVAFFFYETMWSLSDETAADRKAMFRSLFPTPAVRPSLKQGWIPG